jgi:anaerobic magnesium-protoporphyrin IX monomethyl ester cyclase
MNVVLIYPKTGMDFGSTVAPPHALLTIAAPLLQAHYSVKIIDQRVEKHVRWRLYEAIQPDTICVGITCMTGTQVKYALELASLVRKIDPNVPIVWGGCHPSVMPDQTLAHSNVDYVLVGEGDQTFKYMVYAIKNKRDIPRIVYGTEVDMDSLLPTPWELINVEKYIHPDMYLKGNRVLDIGQTSRGCPFQCGFCSSAAIRGRKWRAMSAEKAIKMIEGAAIRFKLDGIWLRDDEFYIDRKRALEICKAIAPLGIKFYTSGTRVDIFSKATEEEIVMLKKAGAHTLKFGAESGCQRTLDRMKKGITPEQTMFVNNQCRRHGITPAYSLIVGYPGETFREIDQTIDFAYRLKRKNPHAQLETMALYTALPGTPDFELATDNGLRVPETLEGWADWVFDDYDEEGKRSPWYTKEERMWLGNISYMSILANALPNVVGSIRNRVLRGICQVLTSPISAFYRWRLKNKRYRFAPDLVVVRWLRHRLMYSA